MDNKEYFYLPMVDAEIRAEGGDTPKIVAYAAKFNVMSQNLGGFREIIRPGFFREALKEQNDIYALFNHEDNYILGERNAGTLRIWEDDIGLRYEADYPQTRMIFDLVISPIERKELKGNSFGFSTKGYGDGYTWEEDEETGAETRILLEGGAKRLYDVSPVTFPAYLGNDIAVRSLEKWKESRGKEIKTGLSKNHKLCLEIEALKKKRRIK